MELANRRKSIEDVIDEHLKKEGIDSENASAIASQIAEFWWLCSVCAGSIEDITIDSELEVGIASLLTLAENFDKYFGLP